MLEQMLVWIPPVTILIALLFTCIFSYYQLKDVKIKKSQRFIVGRTTLRGEGWVK
jgi:CHASE2 domain-containing sensor protein